MFIHIYIYQSFGAVYFFATGRDLPHVVLLICAFIGADEFTTV